MSGDFDNLPGTLKSFDPETGKLQWIFYSTPPPGTPASISGGSTGGQMWNAGTYDPELNLLFVGTGNPTPVLNGPSRPGDNKWTCSIVAINPDTGKLAWGFQASPHDTHDWDAAEVPVLVDATFNGTPRKLLMQASRNAYFFVLDRTTGKNLLTTKFADANWATGVDKDGQPIPNPAKEPARDGRLVAPVAQFASANFVVSRFLPVVRSRTKKYALRDACISSLRGDANVGIGASTGTCGVPVGEDVVGQCLESPRQLPVWGFNRNDPAGPLVVRPRTAGPLAPGVGCRCRRTGG